MVRIGAGTNPWHIMNKDILEAVQIEFTESFDPDNMDLKELRKELREVGKGLCLGEEESVKEFYEAIDSKIKQIRNAFKIKKYIISNITNIINQAVADGWEREHIETEIQAVLKIRESDFDDV